MIAGRITFDTVGTDIEVYLGYEASCVELSVGSSLGNEEQGTYWSYGIGDNTFQDAVSICDKSGTNPADKTKSYANRILVARRKNGAIIQNVLDVELSSISSTSVFFNVYTANSNLSPVLKIHS